MFESGSGPNKSLNAITPRATSAAKSATFADAARGAYTATFTPSACFVFNSRFPATNVPFGPERVHSKTYCSRDPSTVAFPGSGVGASALPVPAIANVSGTLKRNVPVKRFVGYAVRGNQRAGKSKYAPSL